MYLLWNAFRRSNRFRPLIAVAAIAAIAGIGAAGIMINVNVAVWIDPTAAVAELKDRLPPATSVVSFSPIEHRFAYYFGDAIAEVDWPLKADDLPQNVEYFCFMRQPGDIAAARAAGRGRTWYKTPGTLPFAWEEVSSLCVERQVYDESPRMVVVGRVVRPLQKTTSDVTVPQKASSMGTARLIRRK